MTESARDRRLIIAAHGEDFLHAGREFLGIFHEDANEAGADGRAQIRTELAWIETADELVENMTTGDEITRVSNARQYRVADVEPDLGMLRIHLEDMTT